MNSVIETSIAALEQEKSRIEAALAVLRAIEAQAPQVPEAQPARRGRSGRKAMGEEERKRVSERMKLYWANRRQSRGDWA
jgi:hypothetical protein